MGPPDSTNRASRGIAIPLYSPPSSFRPEGKIQIANFKIQAICILQSKLFIRFSMSGSFRQRCRGVIALALLVAMLAGCVERRFTIRSNPPGAQVYVDDYEIGTTPCSHS